MIAIIWNLSRKPSGSVPARNGNVMQTPTPTRLANSRAPTSTESLRHTR